MDGYGAYYQSANNQLNGPTSQIYQPSYLHMVHQNLPLGQRQRQLDQYYRAINRQSRMQSYHPKQHHARRVPRQHRLPAPYELDYYPYYNRS